MARKKAAVEYNDFTGGFITEASPLTYPENASLDEENVNINRDGTRQRRFGMEWTDVADEIIINFALSGLGPGSTTGWTTSSYSWFGVNNDGDINFGVLQHGHTLYFYDLDAEDVSETLVGSIDLSGVSGTFFDVKRFSTAYGKLIVAGGTTNVAEITYNGSTFVARAYNLFVRDKWGIQDSVNKADTRPTILNLNVEYNLRNNGWPFVHLCAGNIRGGVANVLTDPVTYTNTNMGFYPSRADIIWASKLEVVNATVPESVGTYSPWNLEKLLFGATEAPSGRYILDIFNRDTSRDTESGLSISFPHPDHTTGGVIDVASFAGRVWYALREDLLTGDENSPHIGNMILYSQASEDFNRWGACHTRNDITSETFNDVLDSDGGFISLPEAGAIHRIAPLGESLFIFATNGVWEVFGGDTTFSATQQSVLKVTDVGLMSPCSVVVGDNLIGYWSDRGIYTISLEPQTLRGVATNITENTIQTFYDEIPDDLKKNARGSYDTISKQVSWLYTTEDKGSVCYFDKELILNTNKVSFTKRKINSLSKTLGHGPYIIAPLNLRKRLKGSTQEVITDGGTPVTDGGVELTITVSDAEQGTQTGSMYWIADFDGTDEFFRLGGYLDFDFIDYPRIEDINGDFGSDAEAFILTGYLTGGDSSRSKWAPYITVKLKRTESDWLTDGSGNVTVIGESSCTMQAQWQWTNNALAGYWSSEQQVYRLPRFFTLDPSHNISFDVVNTRNKVKGSGDALSLKFSSSPLKDMVLLGWGIDVELDEKV